MPITLKTTTTNKQAKRGTTIDDRPPNTTNPVSLSKESLKSDIKPRVDHPSDSQMDLARIMMLTIDSPRSYAAMDCRTLFHTSN